MRDYFPAVDQVRIISDMIEHQGWQERLEEFTLKPFIRVRSSREDTACPENMVIIEVHFQLEVAGGRKKYSAVKRIKGDEAAILSRAAIDERLQEWFDKVLAIILTP